MLLCNETEVENLEFIMYDSGVEYNLHTGAVVKHKTKLPQFWSLPCVPDLKSPQCRTFCTG